MHRRADVDRSRIGVNRRQLCLPSRSYSPSHGSVPSLLTERRAWAARQINFLTGIAKASPLSSAQQPMDHVCHRGNRHQKADGRSPPPPIIGAPVSTATGGRPIRDGLPRYRAPGAALGSHGAGGSVPRARRWLDHLACGPRPGQPGEPSFRSPGLSAQTRATILLAFVQIGPDQPFDAETPAHTGGDSLALAGPPSQRKKCPRNRVNSKGPALQGNAPPPAAPWTCRDELPSRHGMSLR